MIQAAYYNEIDPFAAQWLRNLIAGGHIAPGEVDERSIEDVTPDDLRGFTQCHFFAGIGVWSHSLRLAGWPDDKPVWTGSCPCQPFSAAGKGDGFADERHLWPHFFHLISERRPEHVFGEQVASGNANTWFDLVQSDLEGVGYAFGLVPFTSASIGAPHIRERAYWVAESVGKQRQKLLPGLAKGNGAEGGRATARPSGFCGAGSVDNSEPLGWNTRRNGDYVRNDRKHSGSAGQVCKLANATGQLHHQCNDSSDERGWSSNSKQNRMGSEPVRALEVNSFWRDADWLLCRDGKWRPVEPGTFPLVDGAAARMGRVESGVARVASSNRVGRLKGYGNAINAQAAAEFIRAYMGVSYGR
ncbi:DNA cytosine methyltransferase [Citrobacter braakii]|uniref:DNA cytosine methyltransferase n=1 Tax=Citrobacter braakii TaxID=57706 RepID=UPI002430500C|nr:DNA cytosine methyltransferase [Citrobacter braakii]WFW79175.1 DNA cytosine methyltransferase [Citrobacter braakii]